MDEPAAGKPVGNVRYDPSIIIRFANGLYSMATLWLVIYSVVGVASGLAVGALLGGGVALLIGGGVGLVLGYLLGDARAQDYRLRAQLALCQVQIEENTRHDGA